MYDGRSPSVVPIATIDSLHSSPVHILAYNPVADVCVSVDEGGMFEYWCYDSLHTPCYTTPTTLAFTHKSDTDLYDYKKQKSAPATLTFSPDYSKFATIGFADRKVKVFIFATGKLLRVYDESLEVISEMQHAGTAVYKVDDMEFGRRIAQDRDIEKGKGGQSGILATILSSSLATVNAVFDESGNFVIYSTLLGVKMVNLVTNKVPTCD
jgi:peptidylprolyl isomerase domain and WD repeat-containing protein 1